jgi:hypothetical protein
MCYRHLIIMPVDVEVAGKTKRRRLKCGEAAFLDPTCVEQLGGYIKSQPQVCRVFWSLVCGLKVFKSQGDGEREILLTLSFGLRETISFKETLIFIKLAFSDDTTLGVSTERSYIHALDNKAKSVKQQLDAILCSVEYNVYELLWFRVTAIT